MPSRKNADGDVLRMVKEFGLGKFLGAMMWLMKEICGMPESDLLCPPVVKEGKFLLSEIMAGGNFGKYRNDDLQRNTLARKRALLPHYPSEVLWMIPWKIWHKCWRMVNS